MVVALLEVKDEVHKVRVYSYSPDIFLQTADRSTQLYYYEFLRCTKRNYTYIRVYNIVLFYFISVVFKKKIPRGAINVY